MFKKIFFLASFLLAACETTNVYPTKVVEVQVVKTSTPAPTVVIEYVDTLDCASVGGHKKGDACESNCEWCSSQEICINTDGDKWNDTCVQGETPIVQPSDPTPVDAPPQATPAEPPVVPFCMDYDNDNFVECVVGCEVATNQLCGDCNNFDATVHPGADELCSDNIDNNCNQQVDEMPCVTYEELCDDNVDNNKNGLTDEDCACLNVNSGKSASNSGFANWCNKCTGECKLLPDIDVTKDSYKLVIVFGTTTSDWPYKDGFIYEFGNTIDDVAFSQYKKFSDWSETSFVHSTFVAIDLDPTKKLVSFNANEYPGKWKLCSGTVIDKIEVQLTLPDVYVVKGGVWTKVNDQIETLMANDLVMIPTPLPFGGNGYPQQLMCTAVLKL